MQQIDSRVLLSSLAACLALQCIPACAQDLRVYTTVADLRSDQPSPQIIARSLTLFHAGRVYDHMEDVGEVVIYEPSAKQFVLIGDNLTATSIQLEEIAHYLDFGAKEAERYATHLGLEQPDAASALQFHLNPTFSTDFSSDTGRLQLRSAYMAYDVATASGPSPKQVAQYLDYTDHAARLNFILSPKSLMPGPRLALNQELQTRKRLPVTVDLKSRVDGERHLRATHKFQWELQPYDRTQITKWENLLESDTLTWKKFREYQQAQLTADAR